MSQETNGTHIVTIGEWREMARMLSDKGGSAFVIGSTDSGKSTLVRYLVGRLHEKMRQVCLVDADVGQSSIGLPGTISVKRFFNEKDFLKYKFDEMSFVGSINPARSIPGIIRITKMVTQEFCGETDAIIIDTSGLISGEAGRALKLGKIRAVKPDRVIAIQKKDELEHILQHLSTVEIYRLPVSPAVKRRSYEARTRYRKNLLAAYFVGARKELHVLDSGKVKCLYHDRIFACGLESIARGTVLGLNSDDETLALGILQNSATDSILFRSPPVSIKRIDRVIFGDFTFP